jgi:hypothetical protein
VKVNKSLDPQAVIARASRLLKTSRPDKSAEHLAWADLAFLFGCHSQTGGVSESRRERQMSGSTGLATFVSWW